MLLRMLHWELRAALHHASHFAAIDVAYRPSQGASDADTFSSAVSDPRAVQRTPGSVDRPRRNGSHTRLRGSPAVTRNRRDAWYSRCGLEAATGVERRHRFDSRALAGT